MFVGSLARLLEEAGHDGSEKSHEVLAPAADACKEEAAFEEVAGESLESGGAEAPSAETESEAEESVRKEDEHFEVKQTEQVEYPESVQKPDGKLGGKVGAAVEVAAQEERADLLSEPQLAAAAEDVVQGSGYYNNALPTKPESRGLGGSSVTSAAACKDFFLKGVEYQAAEVATDKVCGAGEKKKKKKNYTKKLANAGSQAAGREAAWGFLLPAGAAADLPLLLTVVIGVAKVTYTEEERSSLRASRFGTVTVTATSRRRSSGSSRRTWARSALARRFGRCHRRSTLASRLSQAVTETCKRELGNVRPRRT